MPTNVGELVASLSLKTSEFEKGIQSVDAKLKSVDKTVKASSSTTDQYGAALKRTTAVLNEAGVATSGVTRIVQAATSVWSLGALAVGAFATAVKLGTDAIVENAQEVKQLMAVSGLGAEEADNFGDTMKLLGVNTQTATTAMFRLGNEVDTGGAALRRLGISVTNSAGQLKTEGELFLEVRDRISEMGSAGQRSAALIDLFGRSGRELAPIFALNREAFKAYMEQASRISPWSEEAQQKTQALIIEQNKLRMQWDALKEHIGSVVVGPLTTFLSMINAAADKMKELRIPGPQGRRSGSILDSPDAPVPFSAQIPGEFGVMPEIAADSSQRADRMALLKLEIQSRLDAKLNAFKIEEAAQRAAMTMQKVSEQQFIESSIQLSKRRLGAELASIDEQIKAIDELKLKDDQSGTERMKLVEQRKKLTAEQIAHEIALRSSLITADERVNAILIKQSVETAELETKAYEDGLLEQYRLSQEAHQRNQALIEQGLRDHHAAIDAEIAAEEERMRLEATLMTPGQRTLFDLGRARDVNERAAELMPSVSRLTEDFNAVKNALQDLIRQGFDPLDERFIKLKADFDELNVAAPLEQLDQRLRSIDRTAKMLGPDFDQTSAALSAVQQAMEELVARGVDPADARLKELKQRFDELKQTQELKGIFHDVFTGATSGIGQFVSATLRGTKSISAAFDDMVANVVGNIIQNFINRGLKKAEQATFDWLEALAKVGITSLQGFFSSGSTTSVAATDAALAAGVSNAPHLAEGGVVLPRPGGVWTNLAEGGRPEAVIPLDRWGGLGGGTIVQIIDQRGSGTTETQEDTDANGIKRVRVFIRDEVRGMVSDGSFDRMMNAYGVKRQGVQR